MSTLPGVPFYAKFGFKEVRRATDTLPDGTTLEFVLMTAPASLDPDLD
jgi:hypothetical protein